MRPIPSNNSIDPSTSNSSQSPSNEASQHASIPMLADTIPIVIRDSGEFIHYPAGPADLRGLVRRLHPEALEALGAVELCLAGERLESELPHEHRPDPLIGRNSYEQLPGIYASAFCSHEDGANGYYSPEDHTIRLFAHVYEGSTPERTIWEVYLRLETFLSLVHLLVIHHFCRVSGWTAYPSVSEQQAQPFRGLERRWVLESLSEYVDEAYPVQMDNLRCWLLQHGGLALPTRVILGEPPSCWGNDAVLANGNFTVMDAIQSLLKDVIEGVDPMTTQLNFARSLHWVDFYAETLDIINPIRIEQPDWLEAVSLEADVYVHLEDWDRAKPLLNLILARDPANQEARHGQVALFMGTRQWEEVLRATEHLLSSGKRPGWRNCHVYVKRATARIELQDLDGAEAELQTMLDSLDQRYHRAPYNNSVWHRMARELREVIEKRRLSSGSASASASPP